MVVCRTGRRSATGAATGGPTSRTGCFDGDLRGARGGDERRRVGALRSAMSSYLKKNLCTGRARLPPSRTFVPFREGEAPAEPHVHPIPGGRGSRRAARSSDSGRARLPPSRRITQPSAQQELRPPARFALGSAGASPSAPCRLLGRAFGADARQHDADVFVRTRNDLHADDLADPTGGGGPGVGGGLHRRDVAGDERRH